RSPPTRNQVIIVPNRRPPSPHSCNRSRSPLRQCAAAKPSHVMKANSATKMMRAVQFTCCIVLLPRRPSILGREIDDRRENSSDDHPKELVPVEERDPRPRRLHPVVEGRPEHRDELDRKEQIPPAPARPVFPLGRP